MRLLPLFGAAALALAASAGAQDMSKFTDGPVITGFGKVAAVDPDMPVPKNTVFKVMFDGSMPAKPGETNRALDNAARFLNMHVAHGIPERNIHLAVVIYARASGDVANDEYYRAHNNGVANANAPLVKQLIAHGVKIYLCGQSATAFGVTKADMLPGVKMALSAMTAQALLQQQGYLVVQ